MDNANGLDITEVDRESATIRERLAEQPRLKEGLDLQTRHTTARARSAAFAIDVKKLYGYRCAISASELRTPDGKPKVQSAHIFPRGLDGRDDARNGLCLCRRHHWALDAGWISMDDDYKILVREDLPDDEDYRFIRGYEGQRIHLPAVAEAAPRQGVNPTFVQELLGHADVSLTLNVYSHVLPDMDGAAAAAMDDALE